jgi:MFS family permease
LSPWRSLPSRLAAAAKTYEGLDRRIWVLAGVRGINTMGLSLVMSFMALYLVTQRGVSGAASGAIYLAANLCQALANSYAGHLSDRIGHRRIMVAALASRAAVIALLGGLVLAHAPIPVLVPVLVVSASLRGGFEPIASAMVADVAPADRRVAAFGLQRVGINLGWLVGPSLGGLLASRIDYGAVFFCAVPPILLSAWAIGRIEEPRTRSVASRAAAASLLPTPAALADTSPRPRAEIALLLGGALLFSMVQIQLFTTFSIYAKSQVGASEQAIGILYGVNGLTVVLFQIPVVALLSRFSHARGLVAGCVLYIAAFLGMGAATDVFGLGLAVLLTTIGEVVITPAQQATVAEMGDPSRLGRAFGVFGTMQMLGVALGPLFGGLAYDHLRARPLLMWGCLAAMPAVLVGVYARFGALHRRRQARADNPPPVWESQTES